jgi:hypothetical protein
MPEIGWILVILAGIVGWVVIWIYHAHKYIRLLRDYLANDPHCISEDDNDAKIFAAVEEARDDFEKCSGGC